MRFVNLHHICRYKKRLILICGTGAAVKPLYDIGELDENTKKSKFDKVNPQWYERDEDLDQAYADRLITLKRLGCV